MGKEVVYIERFITNGATQIWTDARGTDKKGTILLCNGGAGCCDYLAPVSAMLEDCFRVIRFEQRGCGRSSQDGHYDLQTVLADIETIRKAYGVERWAVGGHSWGGDLALIYAMERPARTTAVLSLAGMGLQRNREWSAAYHENKEKRGEELPPMAYPGNPAVNAQCNSDYAVYIQNSLLYRRLADLRMPVLLLCGGEDLRPYWPTEQLHHLLPNSRFLVIPGAGHYLWLREEAVVRRTLRGFLK